MKDLGAKTLVRCARTAYAYTAKNAVMLDYPIHPRLRNVREVAELTKRYADANCGATGNGSVQDDMIMWSWIRHNAAYKAKPGYEYTHIDYLDHPVQRMVYLMMRNSMKWGARKTQQLQWALKECSVDGMQIHTVLIDSAAYTIDHVALKRTALHVANRLEHHGHTALQALVATPVPSSTPEPVTVDVLPAINPLATASVPTEGATSMTDNPVQIEDFDKLMDTIHQVPALVIERNNLREQVTNIEKQLGENVAMISSLNIHRDNLTKTVADQTHEITVIRDELAVAKVTGNTQIARISVDNHDAAGAVNDLDKISKLLGITTDELKHQMTAFKEACIVTLPNDVAWAAWCDPSKPFSKAPFAYRHSNPFVASGPSGTGKTFLLEALCSHFKGARALITYHERLTQPKLYARERVGNGRTFWQLGAIPMAALCGLPIVHDEFDHAAPDIQSLNHHMLDDGIVHLSDLGLIIYPTDGFNNLFTCNSLTDGDGEYHGEVGSAMKTRFGTAFVDYPTVEDETHTIHVASGLPEDVCERIATVFKALRADEKQRKLTGPFSVRESCNIAKLVINVLKDGGTTADALIMGYQMYVVDKRPRDEQIVAAETIQQSGGVETGGNVDADAFMADILAKAD